MLNRSRKLSMDIFDYSGNKICPLYDSSFDISGQAYNICKTTERNGWKELSFSVPSTMVENGAIVDNYRISYIKPDFKIRIIDDDGTDWFLITKPAQKHSGHNKSFTVTAGHVAQLLKTKNLALEFSDDEGNNIGTAAELLATILDGTGWNPGYVYPFTETRTGATKYRTLKISSKTGAFKMISTLCDTFEAKPIYHGDTKTVDIYPLNPFSSNDYDGGIPKDLSLASQIVELSYGNNIKNVTRTYDTSNVVTSLKPYGSYGDATTGYCGIVGLDYTEYEWTLDSMSKGTYCFTVLDDSNTSITRCFTIDRDINTSVVVHYSLFDIMSSRYVWLEVEDETFGSDEYGGIIQTTYFSSFKDKEDQWNEIIKSNIRGRAYFVEEGSGSSTSIDLGEGTKRSKENELLVLLDFDYFKDVGLFTDFHLQEVAYYQRFLQRLNYEKIDKSLAKSYVEKNLSEIIGGIDYAKLRVASYNVDNGYLKIILDKNYGDDGVIYRTDYDETDDNYFAWTTTSSLTKDGDPINSGASRLYLIYPDGTFARAYLKAKEKADGDTDDDNPSILTFWLEADKVKTDQLDGDNLKNAKFYLFESNSIGGDLCYAENAVDALEQNTADDLKEVTVEHPVYFVSYDDESKFPQPTSSSTEDVYVEYPEWLTVNEYAWLWNYQEGKESQLYFCFYHYFDDETDNTWKKVYYTDTEPTSSDDGAYWYDWQKNKLYHYESGSFVWLDSDAEKTIGSKFSTVRDACIRHDLYTYGKSEKISVTLQNDLNAGNYYIDYYTGTYLLFTTTKGYNSGDVITYDTTKKEANFTITSADASEILLENIKFKAGCITESGKYQTSTSKSVTDYIFIDSGAVYNLRGFGYSYNINVHKYQSSDSGDYEYLGYDTISGYDGSFSYSNGEDYVRFEVNVDTTVTDLYYDTFKAYAGTIDVLATTIGTYKTFVYPADNCYTSANIITTSDTKNPGSSTQTHISEEDGSITSNDVYWACTPAFIHLVPGNSYSITGMMYNNRNITYYVHSYDSNNNWIACEKMDGDGIFKADLSTYAIKICCKCPIEDTETWHTLFDSSVSPNIVVRSTRYTTTVIVTDSTTSQQKTYEHLSPTNNVGETLGTVPLTTKFHETSDALYEGILAEFNNYSDTIDAFENCIKDALGDMFREGFLQKTDYVKGDEEKLYDDALDSIREVAKPSATYNIDYIDLNALDNDIGTTDATSIAWPEIDINTAVHIIDDDIDVNCWAYIDKVQRYYDDPKSTKITINTNLSTITQHSFTDVMTNIANVASSVKGKENLINRASAINTDGTISAEKLVGNIDLSTVKLVSNGSSTYSDSNGNLIFESADGDSAMMLSGNGFKLAKSKNTDGTWSWRSFGDGTGFTADEIKTGYLSSNTIKANSITADKLSSEIGSGLDLSSNVYVQAAATTATSLTGSSVYIGPDSINVSAGGSINISADSTLTISSKNLSLDENGQMKLADGTIEDVKDSSGLTIGNSHICIGESNTSKIDITNEDITFIKKADGEQAESVVLNYDNVVKLLGLLSE